ncbi:MAG: glutamine synthetase family protein, partial [Pseudomonadota bacterium]
MTFDDELAAFRAAHPHIASAEIFMVDLNARLRGKTVPIEALVKLARGTMKMPSSTAGLDFFSEDVIGGGLAVEMGDPDGVIDPVSGTLRPVLWADPLCAQVQVVVRTPDGKVADYDPRNVLAEVVARAAAAGITPVMAVEQEFFLVDQAAPLPACLPSGQRLSAGQVYDMDVARAMAPLTEKITEAATALGAPPEAIVTEYGGGQFEINLHHTDPLTACDQAIALRRAVRATARNAGLDATFMAKPWGDTVGSGLHLHLSVCDNDGRNLFDGGSDTPNGVMKHAIAGLVRHMPGSMLIFAPHLNSYRRFVPGFLCPVEATWSIDNRGAAIRVPETRGKGARIEHRVAGADANPYLVAAAVLAAALDG